MQRQEDVIQLSDHVKEKLKRHRVVSMPLTSNNRLNKYEEVNSANNEKNVPIPNYISRLPTTTSQAMHHHRQTSTSKQSFTSKNIAKGQESHECQECIYLRHAAHSMRQQILRLSEEIRKLTDQLQFYVRLNRQHEEDIEKLRFQMAKSNSHLYQYEFHDDPQKQKIAVENETNPKIDEGEYIEANADKHDVTMDNLKRLRYEVQMYNRIVLAKQEQEYKSLRKQIDFPY